MKTAVSFLRATSTKVFRSFIQRVREQGRPTASRVIRLTGAAVASYLVAARLPPYGPEVLLAPLTAILVTQLTLYSIVYHGLDRVLSVVAGVTIATIFASWLGLTWWSLGLLVACAIIVGQLLRLGPNLVEVPITAMFVMSVGTASAASNGFDRIIETLVGAAVGVGINIAFPPAVRVRNAGVAVERFAGDIAEVLERSADHLPRGATIEHSTGWLATARNFINLTPEVDRVLEHVQESRRLNVRALGVPDANHALRTGLNVLEHMSVAVRSVFRGINDVFYYPDGDEDPFPQAERELTARVLTELAATIRAFGRLVHAQIDDEDHDEERDVIDALARLREARSQAKDAVRTNDYSPLVHEHLVFLIATVGRVYREIDVSGDGWLRYKPSPQRTTRRKALIAADRLRAGTLSLTHKRRTG